MKATLFVDTNIFIRYLVKDDALKAQACLTLFQSVQKDQVRVTTSEAVIAEIVYVLGSTSGYQLSRKEVKKRLYPLLSLAGLQLPQRKSYLRALDLYAQHNIDFEDCLIIAHMERQRISAVYSYDHHFDRVQNIRRVEPPTSVVHAS